MIENHRTHHLTTQEHSLSIRANDGFIQISKVLMPLRHRSDFKQALSTLQRVRQEAGEKTLRAYLLLQAQTMEVGTEFIFNMVELARLLVFFFFNSEVKKDVSQVLSERCDPFSAAFWQESSKMIFTNSTYFVTVASFTADGGHL